MKKKKLMIISLFTIIIVLSIFTYAYAVNDNTKNNERYIVSMEGDIYYCVEDDKTHIAVGIMPDLSPQKDKIVYYNALNTIEPNQFIIETFDINANEYNEIVLDTVYSNYVIGLFWLNEDEICVETHVNPSTSEFFIIDSLSGNVIKSYSGSLFTITKDKKVLYKKNEPHFSPKLECSEFVLDDKTIYKASSLSIELDYPQLSNDSNLIAFIEKSEDKRVVVYGSLDIEDYKIKNILTKDVSDKKGLMYIDGNNNIKIQSSNSNYKLNILENKFIEYENDISIIDKYYESLAKKKDVLEKYFKGKYFNDNISTYEIIDID